MFSANIAKKDDSLNIQQKKIFYFISLFLLLAFIVCFRPLYWGILSSCVDEEKTWKNR